MTADTDVCPWGAVSIDVDTLYSLFGKAYTGGGEIIYERAMPRFLEMLDEVGIRATLFVVGQDLARSATARRVIRTAAGMGHEIGNHTEHHIQGLCYLESLHQRREIIEAHRRIEDVTGAPVVGFRAPGWNIGPSPFDILEEEGYGYDSSMMPSVANPALKLMHWLSTRGGDALQRRTLGSLLHILAPTGPYRPGRQPWRRGSRALVEIPVSVTPGFRLPFFGTFPLLAGDWTYRWTAPLLRRSRRPVNYELHAVEFCDSEGDGARAAIEGVDGLYVPPTLAMELPRKRAFLRQALEDMHNWRPLGPIRQLAEWWTSRLPSESP